MSKTDRVPEAWPGQMSDILAARYCDYSLSQFLLMVRRGDIPAGRQIPGTKMIRWHRSVLDRHLAEIHGLDDDGEVESGPNEWNLRIRGITKPPEQPKTKPLEQHTLRYRQNRRKP